MPAAHNSSLSEDTIINDPKALNIAIIGGGITGVNLALGLEHRRNQNPNLTNKINYTIYERAPSFREIGAGIGFSSNAERAMGVLSPDVLSSFKRVANPNGEDYFQWINGNSDALLFKLYCGKDGFQGCRRSDILEEWAKLIPPKRVHFGKTVDTVTETPQADIKITFTDGSTAHADVIIGCDGIRSRIRQLIIPPTASGQANPAANPHYSAKFCFRALIPMEQAVASLGEYRSSTRFMYNGPGAHVITYPIGKNSVLNAVVVISDPKPWGDLKKLTAMGSKSEAVEAFKGWHPTVRKIIDLLPEEMDKWAVFDMAEFPASGYVSAGGQGGRMCIAGDAAHATGPHLGAGGGMGIEDALVLSALLEDVAVRGGDGYGESKSELIKAGLGVYNDMRYERTQWVVQATRYACDLFQRQDWTARSDGGRFGEDITKTFHKVWEYDVEGMVQDSLAGLGRKIGDC